MYVPGYVAIALSRVFKSDYAPEIVHLVQREQMARPAILLFCRLLLEHGEVTAAEAPRFFLSESVKLLSMLSEYYREVEHLSLDKAGL